MNRHLILPFLLILAGGMGIGSVHNSQARGAMDGFFTPSGFILIAVISLIFLSGFVVFRFYDHPGGISWGWATAAAAVGFVLGALNLIGTLLDVGNLSGWLFHEYLGFIVATLMLAKILSERQRN